jgi:NADPH-dependent curcumin reductase CurA
MTNTKILLNKRPTGTPDADCWKLIEEQLPELENGEVLIKVSYLSIDPAMRGWMNEGRSYIKPVAIGEGMRALGVGEIVDSKNDKYSVGEFVTCNAGVQEFCISDTKDLLKVDAEALPLPVYLGTLGMSGLTAYFGILDTGNPKKGETVVVSGAAGAVGSVVGQIAKIKGCRVVGIAGGKDKCDYVVNELGFDDCVDYKSGNFRKELRAACPEGIDVYFDNVGGEILDTCLMFINKKARIVICGAISQYNAIKPEGPKNYLSLLVNRAKMEGIVVFDNAQNYGTAIIEMTKWIKDGKLNANFYEVNGGVRAFPETLLKLFAGENTGKMVLKIS